MRESSMANAKPPECNSISTTEVAVTDITKGGFNGCTAVSWLLSQPFQVARIHI